MNKKDILKKLKSEKGLTGADVALSVSILVLTVVVVAMIYVNIDIGNKSVNRTAGATRIATNILENIELTNFDEITSKDTKNGDGNKIYNTKVPNGYHAIVTVEDSSSSDAFKLVKKVTVEVKYTVGGEEKNILVSTAVEQKFSKECNKPDFSTNFLINSPDNETKQLSSKIFVPIKYSYILNKYVVTSETDKEWYNYSSKEWAKVLVFDDETVKERFIDLSGNIITGEVEIDSTNKTFKDYLYVWIPNFGKSENKTLVDGTIVEGEYYFRLGSGSAAVDKNALVFENVKTLDEKTLNAYKVDESIIFKDSGTDAIVMGTEGFWRKYKDVPEENTVYEKLNLSKYGPMSMH